MGERSKCISATQAAPYSADNLAVRSEERVEHADILGDTHRVVPGQHHNHGCEIDTLRDPGDVAQILKWIRDHRVGREVVLDRPQRVEPNFVRDASDVDLLEEHFLVRFRGAPGHDLTAFFGLVSIPIGIVLVEQRGAYSHGYGLLGKLMGLES